MIGGMSVVGHVECRKHPAQACLADDNTRRLDSDLELCICKNCGQAWIRDVDVWVRLKDSFEALEAANVRLQQSILAMQNSFNKLGKGK